MREHHEKRQKWLRRDEDRPLLDPPPASRIASLLDAFESGDLGAWWRLNREMTLKPDSEFYGDELQPNLTLLPGWEQATPETKSIILQAAKKYVLEQDSATDKWLGKNTLHRPVFAGYRALRLLLQEDPGMLSDLPPYVWEKWAPIILAYPTTSGLGAPGLIASTFVVSWSIQSSRSSCVSESASASRKPYPSRIFWRT